MQQKPKTSSVSCDNREDSHFDHRLVQHTSGNDENIYFSQLINNIQDYFYK